MYYSQTIEKIKQKIEAAKALKKEAIVIYDLDGTLYDNTHRTLRIILEYAHAHAVKYPQLLEKMLSVTPKNLAYRVVDTLKDAGVSDEKLLQDVTDFWFERFFTDAYCYYDLPVPGAVEFANLTHEWGALNTYLTGRDAPNMLQGTIGTLQRDGFPVGRVDTRIILKQDFETPDEPYKSSVVDHLNRSGEVVAVFDNEPAICNLFHAAFPNAFTFWLDTSCAPGAPKLATEVKTIADFTALFTD